MAKNYRGRSGNLGLVENKVGRALSMGRLNVLLMGGHALRGKTRGLLAAGLEVAAQPST